MSSKGIPFVELLEDEAREELAQLRAARTYQGDNPTYRHKAKQAIMVIGSYVRLRATLANEHSNRLIEARLLQSVQPEQRALGDGK